MGDNRNGGKFSWGLILICVGAFWILSEFGIIPSFWRLVGVFWPMIIIFISLMFHVGFYSNKNNVGLLVPGGILLTVGIVCQCSMLWDMWGFMWPGFVLAPAVGLFELYIFGDRQKGLLIPIGILSGISFFLFTISFNSLGRYAQYIFPAILILVGLVVLLKGKREQDQYQREHYQQQDNYQENNYDNN